MKGITMTETIYKYVLDIVDAQEITLPYVAQIISVCEQRNKLVLYALVSTDKELRQIIHRIRIIETGGTHADGFIRAHRFIGTVSIDGGMSMYHVFEETR